MNSDKLLSKVMFGVIIGTVLSSLAALFDQPFWYEIVRRVGDKRHRQ